jgi:hypothetical protein
MPSAQPVPPSAVSNYEESRVSNLQRKLADLRKRQADQEALAAKAEAAALKYDGDADRTKSASLAAS